MECAKCGRVNSLEAAYCGECGERLQGDAGVATDIERESIALQRGTTYAGFWIRLLAWIIDLVIVLIGSALFSALVSFSTLLGAYFYTYMAFSGVTGLVLPVLYYVLLTGLRGQTVGKMALGIRVVRADGRAPGLGYAALREVVGKFVSVIALFLGFLWIAWDREKQGWHDMIAGTHVVKKTRNTADIGL